MRTRPLLLTLSVAVPVALACGGVGPSPEPGPSAVAPSEAPPEPGAEPEVEPDPPWIQVMPNTPPGRALSDEDEILCQPTSFVPGETRIVDGKLADDKPDDRGRVVKQSDWTERLSVPEGVTVHHWDFMCDPNPSYSDQVLEFRRGGVRTALFTHIHGLHASPDGGRLYFTNLVRIGDTWVRKARILDVRTMEAITLAPAPCYAFRFGGQVFWRDDGFVTTTGYSEWASHTDLCLWEQDGTLVGHVRYDATQFTGHPTVTQGDRPFMLVGHPEHCQAAAVDLRGGAVRVEQREFDDSELGFPPCLATPDDFDAAAFQAFGTPL